MWLHRDDDVMWSHTDGGVLGFQKKGGIMQCQSDGGIMWSQRNGGNLCGLIEMMFCGFKKDGGIVTGYVVSDDKIPVR